jgi:hypothetical protein
MQQPKRTTGRETNQNAAYQAKLKLLLYRNMPAYEEAWLAGFEAAQQEADLSENPYLATEPECNSWESGWWEGFYKVDLDPALESEAQKAYADALAATEQHRILPEKAQSADQGVLYLWILSTAIAVAWMAAMFLLMNSVL